MLDSLKKQYNQIRLPSITLCTWIYSDICTLVEQNGVKVVSPIEHGVLSWDRILVQIDKDNILPETTKVLTEISYITINLNSAVDLVKMDKLITKRWNVSNSRGSLNQESIIHRIKLSESDLKMRYWGKNLENYHVDVTIRFTCLSNLKANTIANSQTLSLDNLETILGELLPPENYRTEEKKHYPKLLRLLSKYRVITAGDLRKLLRKTRYIFMRHEIFGLRDLIQAEINQEPFADYIMNDPESLKYVKERLPLNINQSYTSMVIEAMNDEFTYRKGEPIYEELCTAFNWPE